MPVQQPEPKGKAIGRSMREQVGAYLARMRYTLPLPCSAEELYFGCVPVEVKRWYIEELFEENTQVSPGVASNLMSTMHVTPAVRDTRLRLCILHVSVEGEKEFLEALRGVRGFQGVFWFNTPPCVPVPRNSTQTPFFLPRDHPFHDAINDWVEQAFAIEDEIQTSLALIERYQACAQTATQVANTWPELLNFVSLSHGGGALSKQISHALHRQAAKVLRPTDKETLILQLTRAVMLPEKQSPLPAWVKFYTGDET
jgi:hypothetical protein